MDDSGFGSQDAYIRICFSSLDIQTCLKCYACQLYGLLKYECYYEYRTPIPVWLCHYWKIILCHIAFYICHRRGVVRKDTNMLLVRILLKGF